MNLRQSLLTVICLCLFSQYSLKVSALDVKSSEMRSPVAESIGKESPIPLLFGSALIFADDKTALKDPGRKIWVERTILDLKKDYGKNVAIVFETTKNITFVFEQIGTESWISTEVNPLSDEVSSDYSSYQGIISIEYMKPEAYSIVSTDGVMTSTYYPTKVEQWYGWSDWVLLDVDIDPNIYDSITILTFIFPGITSSVVSVIAYLSSKLIEDDFHLTGVPNVRVKNQAQYYYLNKHGYVYDSLSGNWQNWSIIGSRRTMRWSTAWDVIDGAFVNVTSYPNEPDITYLPTNYDRIEKKYNFDVGTYITQKAREAKESGYPFIDIYGYSEYKLP